MNRWLLAWIGTVCVCASAACGGSEADSNLCDIREASCQQNVFSRVARLRGDSGRRPRVKVITAKERAAGRAAIDDDAGDALIFDRWVRGLAFFKLAPKKYTLPEAREDADEGLLAFYSPNSKEVTIIDRGEPLDTAESMGILAHEYMHALQDAEHDLDEFRKRWARDFDASLAVTALIEGEASHYEYLFDLELHGVDPAGIDWERFYGDWIADQRREFSEDPAPYVTARDRFAYAFGAYLIYHVWDIDGRDGVDRLFEAPLQTTREVMRVASGLRSQRTDRDQVLSRGVPTLPATAELAGVTPLGEFMFDEFFARADPARDRGRRNAPDLLADVFSVQFDPAADRVSATWRVRTATALSLTLTGENLRSLSMVGETIFVADEGGVPDDLTAIEWRPVSAPDSENAEDQPD